MPIAILMPDRPEAPRKSRPSTESGPLPCPLYSGHLLKLGSNDRWQSRLFTFDGSVLACVGKKPKAPVIMTYDPYVSSPFMPSSSSSCHPHPMNPNTKWFIRLQSVTSIQLYNAQPKSYRCFPAAAKKDGLKALSIQTSDGKTLVLRSTKDVELERWFFVLSKIWEYQQQLGALAATAAAAAAVAPGRGAPEVTGAGHGSSGRGAGAMAVLAANADADSKPEPEVEEETHGARHLTAHQQSAQLFQRYLEKQYHQDGQAPLGLEQQHPHHPHAPPQRPLHQQPPQQQQQQQQHQQQPMKQSLYHLRPIQKRTRESFLNYQIPPPPRVSAFLPQGFDWSLQEQGDEDDLPMMFGSASSFLQQHHESQSLTNERERRPLERQQTWNHPQQQQQQQQQHAAVGGGANMMCLARKDLIRSSSAGMAPQVRRVVPASSSMEPGKAAIIDNWRRSLYCPPLLDGSTSLQQVGDRELQQPAQKRGGGMLEGDHSKMAVEDPLFELDDHRTDSRDMDSTLKHSSLGVLDYGPLQVEGATGPRPEMGSVSSDGGDHVVQDLGNLYSREQHGQSRTYQGHQRYSHLPGLDREAVSENHLALPSVSEDNIRTRVSREEDELPLGILQMNRHSRWLNTQLSSDDGTSGVNGESRPLFPTEVIKETTRAHPGHRHRHTLLPSEPITPKQEVPVRKTVGTTSSCSQGMSLDQQSLRVQRTTPSPSNPSVSFHGSSYSHLPINDPDFVFSTLNGNDQGQGYRSIDAAATGQSLHRASSVSPATTVTDLALMNAAEASNRLLVIDTSPYMKMNASYPKYLNPSTRPMRPTGVYLNSLNSPEDEVFPSLTLVPSLAVSMPPSQATTSAVLSKQEMLPLSRSSSARVRRQKSKKSSSSSIRLTISAPIPLLTEYDLLKQEEEQTEQVKVKKVEEDEDEDEPLAVTLSRQQSWKQRQSHYSTHRMSMQQPPPQSSVLAMQTNSQSQKPTASELS